MSCRFGATVIRGTSLASSELLVCQRHLARDAAVLEYKFLPQTLRIGSNTINGYRNEINGYRNEINAAGNTISASRNKIKAECNTINAC